MLRDCDNGQYTSVGSTCLRDYTGIDPGAALFMAKMVSVITLAWEDTEGFIRDGRCNAVDTRRFLADVFFLIQNVGFISSSQARYEPVVPTYTTATDMSHFLAASDSDLTDKYEAALSGNQALADDLITHYAGLVIGSTNNFEYNVKALLSQEVLLLDDRHLAFAAGAVWGFLKVQREKATQASTSVHVGTPGERLELSIVVNKIVPVESQYRQKPNHLVIFSDENGNGFKWLSTNLPKSIQVGSQKLRVKCRIKKHSTYQDMPQTVVTHLALIEPVPQ